MTVNRKSGWLLGIIFGIGCFSILNQSSNFDVNLNKDNAERPVNSSLSSKNEISLVDMSPAVLGEQAPIATYSPEIKPIDNDNL